MNTTNIQYIDSAGKPWTFKLDCTPLQGRMFASLLRSVRNIGSREELNLAYWAEADKNAAFRGEIEHAVLSALQEWTRQPHKGVNVTTVNASTPNGLFVESDDDRVQYYWEKF